MSTILVVDDSIDIRRILASRLTKLGYKVKTAESGAQAVDMLEYETIDLILLDQDMMDMDGIETMNRIGEKVAMPPPAIMMTAYSSLHLALSFMKAGGVDYVEKPFDFDVLNVKIRRAIEIAKRLQSEILQRKRTEEKIRYQASLLENVSDAVISTDMNFVIQSWNVAAEKMYGWTATEAVGQVLGTLLKQEYLYGSGEDIIQTFVRIGHYEGEVIQYRKDGSARNIWGVVSIIRDDEGNPTGVVTVNRDITKRKEIEEALKAYSEQLEEMVEARTQELRDTQEQLIRQEKLAVLGQLAGGVGHELRNPLGVISNAVYVLKMSIAEDDEMGKEYLDIILDRIQEAEKIVSDLLDFSRIQPVQREETAVSTLLSEVWERHPPPKTVTMTTEAANNLPLVYVDAQQVRQILVNLVTNAYHALHNGGELRIKARAEPNQVQITVSDTGYGMPPETIEKIFEPLFTTKPKGIGLGLALSKNLVEANGGHIEVTSTTGQGSTFTVTLPTKKGSARNFRRTGGGGG